MSDLPASCINCGHTLTGQFCAQCGEKVFSEHDKTVKHFSHEVFHFLTHLDGKFLRSLKAVFFKPGLLSLEYCQGIRKKYFKPVSLFLIGVILYLIFPLIQGLNMTHRATIHTYNAIGIGIPEMVSMRKAEKEGITLTELGERYDAKSPKFAKILLLILLPFTAGLLWLLFFRKRVYLFDHLILGTEMNTQFVYTVFLGIPIFLTLIGTIWNLISGNDFHYDDWLIVPLQAVVLAITWGRSLQRFYSLSRWETIWKTFVFFLLHSVLVYIAYRLILFLIVIMFV